MNVRQRKQVIGVAAGVTGAAAVAVGALGVLRPVRVAAPEAAGDLVPATALDAAPDAGAPGDGPTLAELRAVTAVDLRRPLFDPAPTATGGGGGGPNPAAGPATPRMAARLVGTVHERGHSMAMFQAADGSIVFCRVGEGLDDPAGRLTVTRIEPTRVEIAFDGEQRELELPASP